MPQPQPAGMHTPAVEPSVGFRPSSSFDPNPVSRGGGVPDDSIGLLEPVHFDSVALGPKVDEAEVEAREALFTRIETPSYLHSDRPSTGASADVPELMQRLSSEPSFTPDRLDIVRTTPGVADSIARLDASTRDLDTRTRQLFFNAAMTSLPQKTDVILAEVVTSPAFTQLAAPEKQRLAQVMGLLDGRGLQLMGVLIEMGALEKSDSAGGQLLDSLHSLATQPLNPLLSGQTTPDELLSSVMLDIVNPNRIEQGTAPTCTVASMQFELAKELPAEYARLIAGLAGSRGQVPMRGGDSLQLDGGAVNAGNREGRSISQAIFQNAAMEYANGDEQNFDSGLGATIRDGSIVRFGLASSEQTHILSQMFGASYQATPIDASTDVEAVIEKLRQYDVAAHQNRPILLDINPNVRSRFNHSVAYAGISEDRLYFRDPYGALRSMPLNSLRDNIVAIHSPDPNK